MLDAQKLLEDLTDEQRQAVQHVDGPLLIIAGAGSGKTRVITRRVAYLISQGIVPSSILAITFTNKAAGEMKTRVGDLLGRPLRDFGQLEQPWPLVCTFHSLGMRILRRFATRVGLSPNYSIYDAADQERVVKQAIGEAELSATQFTPSAAHHVISDAKNRLLSPAAFAATAHRFPDPQYARIYKHYQQILARNNALDFDDLLLRTAEAFRDQPGILEEVQRRFDYILIDEYQDTNHAQYVVAHAMAQAKRNLCVVGDPDQSIYAWRGADIRNILEFEKDYPDARVVKLERNYRSTQTILDIAAGVIEQNRQRKEKRLWTTNPAGERARFIQGFSEEDEANSVVDHLSALHEAGRPWSQMAVFYRINALSRVIEDALRRRGIPYRVARGVDFYHRKEIKDVLAYLRVVANPGDELSLGRIINVPARGIGDAALKKIDAHAKASGMTLVQVMQEAESVPGLSRPAINGARTFVGLLARWQQIQGSVADVMEKVVEQSGLEAYLRRTGEQEHEELANVHELISMAVAYDEASPEGSLDDFLAQVSLVSDVDTLKDNGGSVTLMTLHAAKGLEFPVVAMIAMEEGILPHARIREHPEQLEEERRLCYVGITRAQEMLLLSRACRRYFRGVAEITAASRFLGEMPREKLEEHSAEPGLPERSPSKPKSPFRKGQRVRHPSFGPGQITDISDMGSQTRAVVQFDRAGRKTLILEYARLEPM